MKEELKTRKYSYLKNGGFKVPSGALTYFLSIITLIFSVFVYLSKPEDNLFLYDLTFILAGVIATVASFSLWRTEKNLEGDFFTPSLFLLIGNLFFSIAEAIWLVYEAVLGIEVPAVSSADFFWVLGYFLFAAFLVKKVWTAYSALSLPQQVAPLLFLLMSILIGYSAILSPLFALPDWDLLSKIIGAVYIFGDFILIGGVVILVLAFSGGTFFLPNALLSAGFILFALADIFYYDLLIKDAYSSGAIWDFGWTIGYLFIAAFAIETDRILKKAISGD